MPLTVVHNPMSVSGVIPDSRDFVTLPLVQATIDSSSNNASHILIGATVGDVLCAVGPANAIGAIPAGTSGQALISNGPGLLPSYSSVVPGGPYLPLSGGTLTSGTSPTLLINTVNESAAGIKLRAGGQTGEGYSHPVGAQSAMYVTGLHTNPPANAGGLDFFNVFGRYTGTMANMTGSAENVEITTDLNGVTVAPTVAVQGLEIDIVTNGANTGITFPDVRGIYATVALTVANGGTFTWARSISAAMPSASTTTGNAITNAASFYAFGMGSQAGGLNPMNAYSLYAEQPTIGTNQWAAFFNGKTEINTTLIVNDYTYFGQPSTGLRVKGADTANTIYQPTGNLGISAAGGLMTLTNAAVGVGLDLNTDAILKIRTRAQTGDASLHLLNVQVEGTLTKYNGVTTVANGVPAIYGTGRSTAQTAAVASVATYTVGAADGSFLVSANVLVTASTTHSFTTTVAYTDEGNTARTLTLNFSQITGTLLTAITNVQGAGAYEGVPLHIRCKASTTITIATTGTFTTVTYNVEGYITQIG